MIFYGTNSSNLDSGTLQNVQCPHCDNVTTFSYDVFGRYAYVYWIPFFPLGKTSVAECSHCKATYKIDNNVPEIKKAFDRKMEVNPVKTPIKHFSFSFILGIIVVGSILYGMKTDSDTSDFAQAPKVDDIYLEVTTSGKYSCSKITKVTKDSIYVMQNNIEYDKKSGVSKLVDGTEGAFDMPYQMSVKEYQDLVKEGKTIYEVKRN